MYGQCQFCGDQDVLLSFIDHAPEWRKWQCQVCCAGADCYKHFGPCASCHVYTVTPQKNSRCSQCNRQQAFADELAKRGLPAGGFELQFHEPPPLPKADRVPGSDLSLQFRQPPPLPKADFVSFNDSVKEKPCLPFSHNKERMEEITSQWMRLQEVAMLNPHRSFNGSGSAPLSPPLGMVNAPANGDEQAAKEQLEKALASFKGGTCMVLPSNVSVTPCPPPQSTISAATAADATPAKRRGCFDRPEAEARVAIESLVKKGYLDPSETFLSPKNKKTTSGEERTETVFFLTAEQSRLTTDWLAMQGWDYEIPSNCVNVDAPKELSVSQKAPAQTIDVTHFASQSPVEIDSADAFACLPKEFSVTGTFNESIIDNDALADVDPNQLCQMVADGRDDDDFDDDFDDDEFDDGTEDDAEDDVNEKQSVKETANPVGPDGEGIANLYDSLYGQMAEDECETCCQALCGCPVEGASKAPTADPESSWRNMIAGLVLDLPFWRGMILLAAAGLAMLPDSPISVRLNAIAETIGQWLSVP